MQPRAIAVIVVARLVFAPWAAAEEPMSRPGPIAAAAAEAARAAEPAKRGPMPRGLKWTGISLLLFSTLPISMAQIGDCAGNESRCREDRNGAYVAGGVYAGTGVLLLVIGAAKRSRTLPSVTWHDGRAMIQQRITF